jgi:hypothetical protein
LRYRGHHSPKANPALDLWSVACRCAGPCVWSRSLPFPSHLGRCGLQTATRHLLTAIALPPAAGRFHHHKVLQAAYDSLADSTRLSVVTHKGKYFLTVQRPRLTWSVAYEGQAPTGRPPEVQLEFRTQSPQVAADSRLRIEYGSAQRLEVVSRGAYSDPGMLTWSHFMHFPVPTAALARILESDSVLVTVGGIVERLKPEQREALRDLLARVGAWPAASDSTRGGA